MNLNQHKIIVWGTKHQILRNLNEWSKFTGSPWLKKVLNRSKYNFQLSQVWLESFLDISQAVPVKTHPPDGHAPRTHQVVTYEEKSHLLSKLSWLKFICKWSHHRKDLQQAFWLSIQTITNRVFSPTLQPFTQKLGSRCIIVEPLVVVSLLVS